MEGRQLEEIPAYLTPQPTDSKEQAEKRAQALQAVMTARQNGSYELAEHLTNEFALDLKKDL